MLKGLILLSTLVLISILLVACGGGKTTTPVVETQAISTQETQPILTQETQTTGGGGTSETPSTTSGVPEDVPIMPNAYEMQISNSENLVYKVKNTVQEVADFYQNELPNYGWETVPNPDSVVGSMAQMSRSKANGDRITFSIQYNPVGEFCIVQIYLTRVP